MAAILKWAGAVLLLSITAPAFAECRCECVEGKAQAICEYSYEYKPVCSTYCPVAPYAVKPIDTPVIPPIGTKSCESKQVLNLQTKQYEWRKVCE